ncbi:coenzyme Q-binding protein COQ10 homolog B, mitochondrial-like [Corticium candelabrum]|uniref:coenzyme Q-binding protein COQ10 homolog B, mitochondrial-like n=1 Tax=Corticium candelabrum TaxID=121492 RepID=UPI002E25B641|nr:coenzyme Q-binding protein COQ10 homolog B, mitochondrial-like [Corticium candelabrum]
MWNVLRIGIIYKGTGLSSRYLFTLPGIVAPPKQTYSKRKVLGYSVDQVYDVVSDVDSYSEFLPWCRESRVFQRRGNQCRGVLVVGFPPILERYVSDMTMIRPHSVQSDASADKLFKHLKTVWKLSPSATGSCLVDFHVDFQFKSSLHSKFSTLFFNQVSRRMVAAFEQRCKDIYGPSVLHVRNVRVNSNSYSSSSGKRS